MTIDSKENVNEFSLILNDFECVKKHFSNSESKKNCYVKIVFNNIAEINSCIYTLELFKEWYQKWIEEEGFKKEVHHKC